MYVHIYICIPMCGQIKGSRWVMTKISPSDDLHSYHPVGVLVAETWQSSLVTDYL